MQKPLCWSVHEARHLAKKAKEKKVVAQMGNQRHSATRTARSVEYIQGGAIGDVHEVHVWTNRPFGFWPQGVPRPAPLAGRPRDSLGRPRHQHRHRGRDEGRPHGPGSPQLGSVPRRGAEVEYHPVYHPFNWRGWVDWGQGALGDMGAHLIDFPVWALEPPLPTVIETESTPFNGALLSRRDDDVLRVQPSKEGPVKMTWYDGGLMPPDPEELGDEKLNTGGGILYVGKKGKLLQDGHAAAAARRRSTTRTARRRSGCRACRTRITR